MIFKVQPQIFLMPNEEDGIDLKVEVLVWIYRASTYLAATLDEALQAICC